MTEGAETLLHRVETSTGSIMISKNAIGRIVLESVGKFRGQATISNHKGKVSGSAKKRVSGGDRKIVGGNADFSNSIDISMGPKGLDIRVYVVINFGTSIGRTTDGLIDEIHRRINEIAGITPNSVAIVVTGMISKRQMLRRNIEVKR